MADIIFAFVVLHYNEPKVTEKCVKAIRENTKKHSSETVSYTHLTLPTTSRV